MEKVAYNANFNNGQLGTAVLLRFSLHAFLNNSPANDNTYSGNPDYTLNGQLSYWYLDWGYTWKGFLPTTLSSTYILPKAYKEGRTFLGWSTDPEGVGYITELPAGFIGTVYAIPLPPLTVLNFSSRVASASLILSCLITLIITDLSLSVKPRRAIT